MTERLPALLIEISEVAGAKAMLDLVAAWGGVEVYIPAQAGDDHWLVQCVGREAADKICKHFAFTCDKARHGARVMLPNLSMRRRQHATRLLESGVSQRRVAQQIGLTQRYVEMIASDMRRKKQGSLF